MSNGGFSVRARQCCRPTWGPWDVTSSASRCRGAAYSMYAFLWILKRFSAALCLLAQVVGSALCKAVSSDTDLWVVVEALDAIFDVFGGDGDIVLPTVKFLGLLPQLERVASGLKKRVVLRITLFVCVKSMSASFVFFFV